MPPLLTSAFLLCLAVKTYGWVVFVAVVFKQRDELVFHEPDEVVGPGVAVLFRRDLEGELLAFESPFVNGHFVSARIDQRTGDLVIGTS